MPWRSPGHVRREHLLLCASKAQDNCSTSQTSKTHARIATTPRESGSCRKARERSLYLRIDQKGAMLFAQSSISFRTPVLLRKSARVRVRILSAKRMRRQVSLPVCPSATYILRPEIPRWLNWLNGVAFKLTPQQDARLWSEFVLHSFCSEVKCADGTDVGSRPLVDASGNLYGTTQFGGSSENGVLYEIATDGTYSVLYNFCSQQGCTDGKYPTNSGGLVMDSSGNIYGVTYDGGCEYCYGTVFEWSGSSLETLHGFNGIGDFPVGGLVMDGSGNLFGTTTSLSETPTVYKLTPGIRESGDTKYISLGCSGGLHPCVESR
jgi:uncharacterized repeat protein (TIGR03803 family)